MESEEDVQKKSVSFNAIVQSFSLERFGSFYSNDSNENSTNIDDMEENSKLEEKKESVNSPLFNIKKQKINVRNRLHDLKIRGINCLVRNKDRSVVKLFKADVWYDKKGNYIQPEDYDDKCEFCNNICLIS